MDDKNVPKTLEELDQIIDNDKKKTVSAGGYVFISLIFPPISTLIAFYLAFKKGILHKVLPLVAIILSVSSILFYFLSITSLLPVLNLNKTYAVQKSESSLGAIGIIIIAIIINVAGLIMGLYLRRKSLRQQSLSTREHIILMSLLIIEFVLTIVVTSAVFSTIYGTIDNSIYSQGF